MAWVLRRNEVGLIYGLTFIDHKHRTVFNGSDISKAYAAKAVVGMLSDRDEQKVYLRKEVQNNFLQKDLGLGEKRGKDENGLLDGLLEMA